MTSEGVQVAGHRRDKNAERQDIARARRRRERLEFALVGADTPSKRFTAAAEYVRSALARASHTAAHELVDQMVTELVARADALTQPAPADERRTA